MMRKALFQIDDGPVYIGYTNGDRWNGWATPYFTFEEARKLQADWNRETEYPMFYDVSKDEFRVRYEDYDEPYIWKGEDIQTVDGIRHLYGIGAYSHIWDELGEADKRYLAQMVNDFLYDYDPYEYDDQYDDSDEVVEDIIVQLTNMHTFIKVCAIMSDDTLTADEIYIKLEEELTL